MNSFLGFGAVGRIKIVQKPMKKAPERPKPRLRPISSAEEARIGKVVSGVEDEGLRQSLERLGRTILGSKR